MKQKESQATYFKKLALSTLSSNGLLVVFGVAILGFGLYFASGGAESPKHTGEQNAFTRRTDDAKKVDESKTQQAGGDTINQKRKTMDQPIIAENKVVHGAVISTNYGDIEVKFNEDMAPKTVANFVSLASTNFYDGIKFHRVISGFMIQAGDPLSKDDSKQAYWGTGGPGYRFDDELSGKEQYTYGTLAMANAGPNTNGSQFFIVSANPSVPLPPAYTVFGKVVSGMDVVERIQNVETDKSNDRPLTPVTIKTVTLQ